MERIILHSDLNNFYASVECLYHPELQGKPIAVAGDESARHGIVLAKNEEAKRCGVQTGAPLWMARQKCPDIIFVPPHHDRYLQFSKIAREIYAHYTDQVESFGLDECWLDVSGSTSLFGSGKEIADKIRKRIRQELGVTASVGVSYNKIFAKLGSDIKKPDATTVVDSAHFREIVWPLPVGDLLYVGRATCRRLQQCGIRKIGDLAQADCMFLEKLLGKSGRMLWLYANGMDASPVVSMDEKVPIKSISNGTTTPRDLTTDQDIRIVLYALCESVSARLRDTNLLCRTVQVSIRDNTLHTVERQGPLEIPCRTAEVLFERAYTLVMRNRGSLPIRSLSVRACDLEDPRAAQLSFLPDFSKIDKKELLENTVDSLRKKFGAFSLRRGIMLSDPSLSNFDPYHEHGSLPSERGEPF